MQTSVGGSTNNPVAELQPGSFGAFTDNSGSAGNTTINTARGKAAIAAGAAAVTVTNQLVMATSLVLVVLQTNDATAILKNVVPANGSFVVNTTAVTTAATSFGFVVIN